MIRTLTQMGPDDWLNLFGRIWPHLVVAVLGVFVACWLASIRVKKTNLNWVAAISVVIIATGLIVTALFRPARMQMDLTLLGAEDDRLSESAYFRISRYADNAALLSAIKNPKEDMYVRFYIAAILGARLRHMEGKAVLCILGKLRSLTPIERPRFFTVNEINREAETFEFPIRPDAIALRFMKVQPDTSRDP